MPVFITEAVDGFIVENGEGKPRFFRTPEEVISYLQSLLIPVSQKFGEGDL